jgi:charged multivesicular body protein 4
MTYFTGRKDGKSSAREAIVGLRTQLGMLEKKEQHVQRQIDEQLKKAKANAVTNKKAATDALRSKKRLETELDRISGTRQTLETQVSAIESANMNAETMVAMKKGADALKTIHKQLNIENVDVTMDAIREEMERTQEIQEAISNPINMGDTIDEDELKDELAGLEEEVLNDRLQGADHVPVHSPISVGPSKAPVARVAEEEDEEAALRELQASLAM